MAVSVGILTIDLRANTASFSQSMDKMSHLSTKTANDIKRSLQTITVAGAAMVAGWATGTAAMIESSVATIGGLSRMAKQAGTTADKFSVLAYAAKLNHTELGDLTGAMDKLAKASFQAQNGNHQLAGVFNRLGVSISDNKGHLRDTSDMFADVAAKFSQMGTGAGKAALAMAVFGRSGAQMIPLLNDYGAHQKEITEEAEKFGLVIGGDVPAKVRAYHEVITKLHAAQQGFGLQLTVAVLPALTKFSEKLQEIGSRIDVKKLAEMFGAQVTKAIDLVTSALGFALEHLSEIKIALLGLAAIKIGNIALPFISGLAAADFSVLGKGIAMAVPGAMKLATGLSGVTSAYYGVAKGATIAEVASVGVSVGFARVGTALTALRGLSLASMWASLTTGLRAIPSLLTLVTTGAATAGRALMLAALSNPFTAAALAITLLVAVLYKFRDSTFSLNGTTYKLRDTWNAAWIAMGWGVSWLGKKFSPLIDGLKSLWKGLISWFSQFSVVQVIGDMFGKAFEWIKGLLGKLTPEWVGKALDQAKLEREGKGAAGPKKGKTDTEPPPGPPPPDTSGLGKSKESPVGKLLAGLQEKLDESKQTLAAAGLEEEAQRKVVAANKASNEILKLGEEIAKQTGSATKDYASLVDGATQSLIREKNAQISDNEAKTQLLNLLGTASRASALSISQSGLMIQAMDKGSDAILRQTAVTQAWNELRAKGGSLAQILTRSGEIYAESVAKETVNLKGNIISLGEELAARRIVNDALLSGIDAQDEAALRAKLYALDVQIAGAATGELRDKLLALRAAMVGVNEEEKRSGDLQNARALRSPAAQYEDEQTKLNDAVAAMEALNGRTANYAESLQITAKAQENLNRQVDETVRLLLFEGSASNGMKAFFLDMQKQAITAGQIIYEALHQAFEKLSDNLAQLVTGGKTSFAKMFEDIGRQMVKSTIQSAMQKGLGALGKVLPASIGGPLSDALKGKPDGTRNNPLFVQMVGAGGIAGNTGGYVNELGDLIGGKKDNKDNSGDGSGRKNELGDVLGGLFSKKSDSGDDNSGGGGFWGFLGKLFKKGGSSGDSSDDGGDSGGGGFWASLMGALTPHAEGGPVSPGTAYLVGERGPEILTGASGSITSNVASRRMLGGSTGPNLYYSIDARGTDPAQTEQRTRTAILAAHNSAISNAVQVSAERLKRTPQR